ncbi:MAG TPA: 5-oxoprolinase subunit PxpB [Chthoniobacterales bacterium]|jgi:inhibitor of KinA|nr:5-oxoprolinase subunit PxpB [Chthoniobacterales bacterium]
MEILPLGDSALLLRVVENFDEDPDVALNKVLAVKHALDAAELPGAIELTSAYSTVAFFYDPVRAVDQGGPASDLLAWFAQRIRDALPSSLNKPPLRALKTSELVEIPVCYDHEFALDLDEVAKRVGIGAREVVDVHSGAEYRVQCVGFTPGFPYLAGLPEILATPRKNIPRREIPAGSVAIGGSQTGIYPIKSPGGWHVIGRTPLLLFNPEKNPPARLSAGDRVRFRPISRDEFERSTS